MVRLGLFAAVSVFAVSMCASEIPADTGVPVSVLVTVQRQGSVQTDPITHDDVLVSQHNQHRQVTSLEPLRSLGGVQIWILIDDGTETDLGAQLGDLRRFVLAQPATTEIGVGYLRNGSVQKVQPLTGNHELAAKAMRLPTGPAGISASPYLALSELIHSWPSGPAAREVLLVSSGIDPDYGTGPANPYLDNAIRAAQRAGLVVYSIYYPGAGRLGHAGSEVFWGQNYLAQLCDGTGGELYWLGAEAPVSLAPYLDDVSRRLDGQYLLTFLASPENKAGFQNLAIKTELPHVSLTAPSQVYVPASR